MPPHMGDQDLWADDRALRDWFACCGGDGHISHMAKAGKAAGLDDTFEKAHQVNRCLPELRAFDRYGMRITEMMALALQGALLTRNAPAAVAEAFCASRLAPRYRGTFGTLPQGCDLGSIIDRAMAG